MQTTQQLEEKYLKAKDAYYNGTPIMTDDEFNALEDILKWRGSNVIEKVGAWDRKAKYEHVTPMKSLEKIQADKNDNTPPTNEFLAWLKNNLKFCQDNNITLECEQKFDGNAVNLIYVNGRLFQALSRGDGKLGRDYLSKIDTTQIPLQIPIKDYKVEVRCEAVISKEVFAEKYAKDFSNERNYVAGILNSDEVTDASNEIDLIPVDVRYIDNNGDIVYLNLSDIHTWGFKHYSAISFYYADIAYMSFPSIFNLFYSYKTQDKYRIDGMVIKFPAKYRNLLGETSHHPKWAVAIKFKPDDCITEIIGFEMKMGKTGVFTPVALLNPVDLDGSIVSKASAYNFDFISKNQLNVGACVSIVKSGDIIPQILNIISPSDIPYELNEVCPYCFTPLVVENDKHIVCPSPECKGKLLQKFINSMNVLDLYSVGNTFLSNLYNKIGFSARWYITTPMDEIYTLVSSHFGQTKTVLNFLSELEKKQHFTIQDIIAFMSFDGISNNGRTVQEVAKKLSGCEYSFAGLDRTVVSGWEKGESKYEQVMSLVNSITKIGKTVEFITASITPNDTIKICMTGSPKSFGYKTKKEYIELLKSKGYCIEEVDVKNCDYLITDDLSSTSSKMKTAQKLGKNIKTYEFADYE